MLRCTTKNQEVKIGERDGTTSWGDSVGVNRANCVGCGSAWDGEQTAPVGSFEANGWGFTTCTAARVWHLCQYGERTVPWISLTPQGIHGISTRSSDSLPTHRQQSDHQRHHPT